MSVFLSPIGNGFQFLTSGGLPLTAGTLSTYGAGSSTPLTTYTTSAGTVANPNPVVLNADGRPPQEIWLSAGMGYKFVLADSLGNVLATYDNLIGINDPTGLSEWQPAGVPTYISATQFSVTGNQLGLFQTGRRVQCIVTGTTIYGTVNTSTFASGVTTVTIVPDAGGLNSGLSLVNYGLLNAGNPSVPVVLKTLTPFAASANLAVAQTGQDFPTTAACTLTLPSATHTGWNGTIYGNATGAVTVTTGLTPTPAPTLSSVAGGLLAATTYYVRTSITSAEGQQTVPGTEGSIAIAADNVPSVASPTTSLINATWSVFASTASGTETLQASGIPIGTDWTMPVAGLVNGSAMPTTQGGLIVLPDGSTVTSYALATAAGCGIGLVADGTNYRAKTFGPTIVAPATAANQAVNQSQVANATPPVGAADSGSATTITATSGTFTAPSTGTLLIMGYGQTNQPANGGTGIGASLAGLTTLAELVRAGTNAFALSALPMAAGQSTTISFNFTVATAGAMDAVVYSVFIPQP